MNISPTDAAWFFDLAKRGDGVDIIHTAVGPRLSDQGMSDWNIPFAAWANRQTSFGPTGRSRA